jgi:hypothetical protein
MKSERKGKRMRRERGLEKLTLTKIVWSEGKRAIAEKHIKMIKEY